MIFSVVGTGTKAPPPITLSEEAKEEWELEDVNNEEEEGDIFNHLHIFSHWFEAVFVLK